MLRERLHSWRSRVLALRAVDPQKTAFVLWTTVDALFTQKVYRYEELLPSTPVLSEMVCAVVKAFALMTAGAEIQSKARRRGE
jgi:hypothetical protein